MSEDDELVVRLRKMKADQSLRSSTFHQHAQADADIPRGRFSAVDAAYVVGSKPDVASAYTAAGAHQRDPCGTEPPLGYRVDELEPPGLATEAQGPTGDAVVAPSSTTPLVDDVERAASSLSFGDPAGDLPSPPGTSRDVNAGSLPRPYRRF